MASYRVVFSQKSLVENKDATAVRLLLWREPDDYLGPRAFMVSGIELASNGWVPNNIEPHRYWAAVAAWSARQIEAAALRGEPCEYQSDVLLQPVNSDEVLALAQSTEYLPSLDDDATIYEFEA